MYRLIDPVLSFVSHPSFDNALVSDVRTRYSALISPALAALRGFSDHDWTCASQNSCSSSSDTAVEEEIGALVTTIALSSA